MPCINRHYTEELKVLGMTKKPLTKKKKNYLNFGQTKNFSALTCRFKSTSADINYITIKPILLTIVNGVIGNI